MSGIENAADYSRFVFVDAPPSSRAGAARSEEHRQFSEALRAAPGRWAKYPAEHKTPASWRNRAANIRGGVLKHFPKGEFEAVARQGEVYVRYIGGVS